MLVFSSMLTGVITATGFIATSFDFSLSVLSSCYTFLTSIQMAAAFSFTNQTHRPVFIALLLTHRVHLPIVLVCYMDVLCYKNLYGCTVYINRAWSGSSPEERPGLAAPPWSGWCRTERAR
jgi:hypothetical protein